jgi:VanZ family protein
MAYRWSRLLFHNLRCHETGALVTEVNRRKNRRGRLFRYAPIFLWIGVILFLSSPAGSMDETSRFVGPLLNFFFPNMAEETRQLVHAYVRKSAHFTEYAVLAFVVFRALVGSSVVLLNKLRYMLPIILVAVIAFIDEYNQSFEPSRTGSYRDVFLDISGGLTIVLILWLWQRRRSAVGSARMQSDPT